MKSVWYLDLLVRCNIGNAICYKVILKITIKNYKTFAVFRQIWLCNVKKLCQDTNGFYANLFYLCFVHDSEVLPSKEEIKHLNRIIEGKTSLLA